MKNNLNHKAEVHFESTNPKCDMDELNAILDSFRTPINEEWASCCLSDDELAYHQLLASCDEWERDLLAEVADGDYWLARSILIDLHKD